MNISKKKTMEQVEKIFTEKLKKQTNFLKNNNIANEKSLIKYESECYNKWKSYNDVFLDPVMAYRCLLYQKTVMQKDQSMFMGILGKPGWGKSTLAENIACFLDPKYTLQQTCEDLTELAEIISRLISENSIRHKAIIVDEQAQSLSPASADYKLLADILSKIRGSNVYLIFCGTSMNHFKADIIQKFQTLIYFHKSYYYHIFEDNNIPILQKNWKMYGHAAFTWNRVKKMCPQYYFNRYSKGETPLKEFKEDYRKLKEKSLLRTIQQSGKVKNTKKKEIKEDLKIILRAKSRGLSNSKIAEVFGVSQQAISKRLKRYEERNEE
jgi:DNA-binding Lrp family transcriptional regulator